MPRSSLFADALSLCKDGATLWSNELWRSAAAAGASWEPADSSRTGALEHLDHWVQQVAHGAGVMRLRSIGWVDAVWRLSAESLGGSLQGCMVRLHAENFPSRSEDLLRCSVLAVDDEPFILNSLRRLLRRTQFDLRTAGSAEEACEMLLVEPVDIILSDQRMPGMTGVQLLSHVRDHMPDTVRIILSGYSDAQSITDAINEGAVYKFVAKPWEDQQLLLALNEAAELHRTRMKTRQLQLAVATANAELADANRRLTQILCEQDHKLTLGDYALTLAHDMNDALPFPVLGLDSDGEVVTANRAAALCLTTRTPGASLAELAAGQGPGCRSGFAFAGRLWTLGIGELANGSGRVLALIPEASNEH